MPCEKKKQRAAEGKMKERELLRMIKKNFKRSGV